MALPALATIPDLARRTLGDPAGIAEGTPDYVRAEVALEDASSAAREASGDLEAWSDASLAPHPVVRVVLAAARRWWENPEAYTGESLGDSITYSRKAEGLSVALTEEERRTCASYGPARSSAGLTSIPLRIGGERRGPRAIEVPVEVPGQGDIGADAFPLLDPDDPAAPDPEE